MAEQVQSTPTILRLHQLRSRIGRSRSSLYADIAAGSFPAPIKLGARAVGWLESEVNEWLSQRIEERRETAANGSCGDIASSSKPSRSGGRR
jgi:prophage regulatory protein